VDVAVVGSGYVGLVVGACLAEVGHSVVCADVDDLKIERLQRNVSPIFEPGLDALLERGQRAGRLRFTTDVGAAIGGAEVAFIAVGTPPDEDGSADLRHVLAVADQIGRHMRRETVVVTKSTVPVGTARKVAAAVGRHARHRFHVCSNPEFLKEGSAVLDFMKPDRVVIGVESEHAARVMAALYAPFTHAGAPLLVMDVASAELTKYAANAMLATRISFMNEIANLCERVGADVELVREGIGADGRIGPAFLHAGPGYGGSCFPKDVKALARTAAQHGARLRILESVEAVNEAQKRRLFDKLSRALDGALSGARVAVWGLAFKPNTDDMREAPSLTLVEALLSAGASVVVHDPVAMDEAERRLGGRVEYAERACDALRGADALVVVTDWDEYRRADCRRIAQLLRRRIVVDGRNIFRGAELARLGIAYYAVGRRGEDAAPALGEPRLWSEESTELPAAKLAAAEGAR
jgi:UDPglucose 6-dehydrogenase